MRSLVVFLSILFAGGTVAMAANDLEKGYSFALPFGWNDVSEPDVIAYESHDHKQSLVIGEYVAKKQLPMPELEQALKKVVELRRKVELQAAKGDATIDPASITVESWGVKAEFRGRREQSRIFNATIIYATPNRMVSWRFEAQSLSSLDQTLELVRPTLAAR